MKEEPFVLCLTNTVAANFTANVLLAVGAKPAMVEEPCEAAELAVCADAVLVNVGTLTARQAEAMRAAVRVCCVGGTPWVLDPVAVQALAFRRDFVRELLALGPTLLRGNHGEIDFLLRTEPAARACAAILSTGETDCLRAGAETLEIAGGTSLLTRVTATGCAQGALAAVCLGAGLAPRDAARATSRLLKRAGERAAATAHGPGSFQAALLDALFELTRATPLAAFAQNV